MAENVYGVRQVRLTQLDTTTGLPTGDSYEINDAVADDGNAGTGSMASGGDFSGSVEYTYEIVVVTENTVEQTITTAEFLWRKNNGAWSAAVTVTGAAQALDNGVTVTFTAGASGQDFELGDTWTIWVQAEAVTISTPQMLSMAPVIEEGQAGVLRGGDDLICRVQENDELVGVDLTFRDAQLNGPGVAIIDGGTWSVGDQKYTPRAIGAAQTPFKLEVWAARYADGSFEGEDLEGYLKFSFYYCKGQIPNNQSLEDRSFVTPSYTIKARENRAASLGAYIWEEVADLT